jgi:Xaa-Pro dipeptidase
LGQLAPISPAERRERISRVQAELRGRGLDGLLLTERANFEYFVGFNVGPLWSSFTRILAIVVPASGDPTLLLPAFIAKEAGLETSWPVTPYASLDRGAAELVAGVLEVTGLATGRLGIERGRESRLGTTWDEIEQLRGRLPGASLEDGSEALWAVRAIKSAAEIERLHIACRANEAGFAAGFGRPRTGAIEQNVAGEMFAAGTTAGTAMGAWVQPGWIGMTSGPGGYARFVSGPRRRALELGDMVWADLGFTADGYWSDYCRAAVVGGPTARQVDRQRRIDEATSAGIDMLRPGVAVADVARKMRSVSARLGLAGLGFGRLGHGIGLTATEPPSVVELDPTILVAGMVVTVEPAATEDDGLYCAEQIVVVADPPRLLSTEPTELRSI